MTFPTRAIGSLGLLHATPFAHALSTLYASLSTRFLSQSEQRGIVTGFTQFHPGGDTTAIDSSTIIGHRTVNRWGGQSDGSLRDSRQLFGWLNLSPAIATSIALFDVDALGHRAVPVGVWNASVTTGTTIYGASKIRIGRLVGIRHVIAPSVSFSYSPNFPGLTYRDSLGDHNRFEGFSGIGLSGFRNERMFFTLDQRWQAKVEHKGAIERIDNLLLWTIGGSYDFLYRDEGLIHPLSQLASSVRLSPPGVLAADLQWVTDVYSQRPIRSLGYTIGMNLSGAGRSTPSTPDLPLERRESRYDIEERQPWALGLTFSYAGGYPTIEPRWKSTMTTNILSRFDLSQSWQIEYSALLDLTGGQMLNQRFGLTRDLHCWQASFTRSFTVGGEAEYYFRLSIKDQREVFIERGTRLGSLGGIQ